MAGVSGAGSGWTGRVTPVLVAAFQAGRAELAPSGLTVDLLQARWRETDGLWTTLISHPFIRWLVVVLGLWRWLPPPAAIVVTVSIAPDRDGHPQVGVMHRPASWRDSDHDTGQGSSIDGRDVVGDGEMIHVYHQLTHRGFVQPGHGVDGRYLDQA